MKNSTKIILIVVCLILALSLIVILIQGILYGDTFYEGELKLIKEELVSLESIHEIDVQDNLADIHIYSTDESNLRIVQRARRKIKEKDQFQTTIDDDVLKIKGKKKINFCIGFCFFPSNSYDIYIPSSYQEKITLQTSSGDIVLDFSKFSQVRLKTVSGDIKIKNQLVADDIQLKTTSGDIVGSEIKGLLIQMNTVSGDMEIEKMEGSVTLKTTSGDIENDWLQGELDVSTVSGDIEFDHLNLLGNSKLKSTSGDIDLTLDSNSSIKMSADSVSGDIRFPHAESIVGAGDHTLSMKTVSGDIRVKLSK